MSVVEAARHFYYVVESGTVPDNFVLSGTGLVDGGGGAAMIYTGTANGPVDVTVQLLASRPSVVEEGWPEVAEVSIFSSGEQFRLINMDGEGKVEIPLPSAGDYRLRVHARGRDRANEFILPLEEVLEYQLLQLWPEPSTPPTLIAGSDEIGEGLGRTLTPTGIS